MGIHGGIDGFSRKVLWCKVGYTNGDPKIIAGYFMKAVKQCTGSQVLLHVSYVEKMEQFLRQNDLDSWGGNNSFLYGKSIGIHYIERWWRDLKQQCIDKWVRLLHRLREMDNLMVIFLIRV